MATREAPDVIGLYIDAAARPLAGREEPTVSISLGSSWGPGLYGVDTHILVVTDASVVRAVFRRGDYEGPSEWWSAATRAYADLEQGG